MPGPNPAALRAVQERVVRKALTIAAVKVQAKARELAPVDEGTLRRSITFSITGSSPATMQARVGSNVFYAPFVSRGTRPHVIRPKTKPFLVFPAKGGGLVFAKEVHHPGTKPNDYLSRALDAIRR